MNIEGGGDKGGGDTGGGGLGDQGLRDEAWRPSDKTNDATRVSDKGSENAMEAANTLVASVTNTTSDLRNRMANDPAAQENFDNVGAETCQVLKEQNERAKVPAVAAATITAAFQAGVDKSVKAMA